MSNLPPNPYNANVGPPPVNAGQQVYTQPSQPMQGVNQAQYSGLRQYPNSNSPVSTQPIANNHGSYNSSTNNSPAFNRPGQPTLPPPPSGMLPPGTGKPLPMSSAASISASSPFPPNYQPSRPITNAPPAAPYSQPSKPFVNGPVSSTSSPVPVSSVQQAGIGVNSSSMFTPTHTRPPSSSIASQQVYPPQAVPAQPMSQSVTPHFNAPMIGSNLSATGYNSGPPTSHALPPSNVQPSAFTPLSKPNTSYPGSMLPNTSTVSGQPPMNMSSVSSPNQPQFSQPNVPPSVPSGPSYPPTHTSVTHPQTGLQPSTVNGTGNPIGSFPLTPPGPQARQPMQQPFNGPQAPGSLPPGPPSFPINRQPNMPSQMNAPTSYPPTSSYQQPARPGQPPTSGPPYSAPPMVPNAMGPQQPPPMGQQPPPLGPQNMPGQPGPPPMKMPPPPGPPSGPLGSTMQNRYPQMPPTHQNAQMPPQPGQYQQQQYNTQAVTQQMGQMSVTKQGFDQLWGHQTVDLLQCKHILPDYPEAPPEIKLGQQFAESANCSPDIFRCTVNRIPENNSLLQKSRLPLGILIHPFKDLDYLPVIQCSTIVRCRACRTYINPFVYFVDSKRWKCNLCFRVNDLPEEFQYDPVSKSYGDPSRRPEIKSATIEFIAPGEYMLRPPQPAVYLFLMDVSQLARESGYLEVFCKTLSDCLQQLPGDARTQVGFICYDAHIHYYLMSDGLTRPKEMTVLDIDDVFLPSPEALLVNLGERKELIMELLAILPKRYSTPGVPASALGAALQAAYKLMAPTGGRITVLQTCLPNIGPGALQSREDPNARSAKDVAHLNPATDFYKRLALDCSGVQVAVDLFLLNSQYSDLATLSGISKFSGGSVYHIPLFKSSRVWQQDQFRRMLSRYLTRKIGFEAVMRVRCTRGVGIHTFHGNFFVRSTDLLSLPNVSPDTGFGMQLTIEESLNDLQQVCFQAALLYTSSKGERRIRVHTMALPIASNLTEVLHAADTQCIIGLLVKMAVDRCQSASMSEAREALINVAIDVMGAHKLAQNLSGASGLMAPASLSLLPLYLLAALKTKAFRTGTSTRLDDRVAQMCEMKTLPLTRLIRAVYPDLYPIHELFSHDSGHGPDPPRLQLTAERVNSNCAYLLDDGETMIIYIGHAVSPAYLSETFGVTSFNQLPDEARSIPRLEEDENQMLHLFIDSLNDDRPYESNILVLRDNSPSRHLFTERLIEDRVESSFSYYEFLQHVKSQVK